jgi:ligand-binding sensor domain-containing protein
MLSHQGYQVLSLAASDTNLFAGTSGAGSFLSTDKGTSWAPVNAGLTNSWILALAVSGTNLFAGTSGGGIFLSTNNGTNWKAADSGLTSDYVNALASSGTNLFAGTGGSGVFLSTNSGTNWSAVNSGLTSYTVFDLALSGTDLFAETDDGVFVSTNEGASWTAINTGSSYGIVFGLAASGTNLFAEIGGGVFLSTNSGASWDAVGITNTTAYSLAISGGDLFVGTSRGVYRRAVSEMTPVRGPTTDTPTHFALDQNYPNPFNPSTTIRFDIPSRLFVTLKVFDILGREVASLVSEQLSTGHHSRVWKAADMPSGMYFYRLQAGSFAETKKLLLVK